LKAISYILIIAAGFVAGIGAYLFLSSKKRERSDKLEQLAEARKIKAEKKILRDQEENLNEEIENILNIDQNGIQNEIKEGQN